ncbi:MAG TPA: hypothetical protein VIU82_21970 [Bosea sp. (in: a-proteobacteria)]
MTDANAAPASPPDVGAEEFLTPAERAAKDRRNLSASLSKETRPMSDEPIVADEVEALLVRRLMSWREKDERADRGTWHGVSEIAGAVVMPKPKVRAALASLAEAGKIERSDVSNGTFWRALTATTAKLSSETEGDAKLRARVAEAVAAEREACALIAVAHHPGSIIAREIAAAIRARSNTGGGDER